MGGGVQKQKKKNNRNKTRFGYVRVSGRLSTCAREARAVGHSTLKMFLKSCLHRVEGVPTAMIKNGGGVQTKNRKTKNSILIRARSARIRSAQHRRARSARGRSFDFEIFFEKLSSSC